MTVMVGTVDGTVGGTVSGAVGGAVGGAVAGWRRLEGELRGERKLRTPCRRRGRLRDRGCHCDAAATAHGGTQPTSLWWCAAAWGWGDCIVSDARPLLRSLSPLPPPLSVSLSMRVLVFLGRRGGSAATHSAARRHCASPTLECQSAAHGWGGHQPGEAYFTREGGGMMVPTPAGGAGVGRVRLVCRPRRDGV